jgi:hypothetical protein
MRSAAFAVFDLGTKGGFDDVLDAGKAEAALCACRDVGCSSESMAQAVRLASDARDAAGRRMRKGVQELDEPTAGDCRSPETNVVSAPAPQRLVLTNSPRADLRASSSRSRAATT